MNFRYSAFLIMAIFALLALQFQNCTSDVHSVAPTVSASVASGNGQGYDGMVYNRSLGIGVCADGSPIVSSITLQSASQGILTRENCVSLLASQAFSVFVQVSSDGSSLIFQGNIYNYVAIPAQTPSPTPAPTPSPTPNPTLNATPTPTPSPTPSLNCDLFETPLKVSQLINGASCAGTYSNVNVQGTSCPLAGQTYASITCTFTCVNGTILRSGSPGCDIGNGACGGSISNAGSSETCVAFDGSVH